MKKTTFLRISLRRLVAVAALAALPQIAGAQLLTNWVAFNDHGPSATTAPNVSPYNMRGGTSGADAANVYPTQGPLTNYAAGALPAGQQLSARMVVTTQGAVPQNFVNAAMGYPDAGTPAYDLFNGIIDLGNSPGGIGLTAGQKIIVTFTGLDPAMRYSLRATAVRNGTVNGANHPGRWTTCAIEGADSFVDAHTAGCLTSLTPLPEYIRPDGVPVIFPATNLPPGRAVFQSGMNTQGNMVGWDDIRPGADGAFSYTSEAWTRQVTNLFQNIAALDPLETPVRITNAWDNLGYPPIGLRLVEYGPLTPVSITAQPVPSTTLTQLYAFSLSVAAFGTAPQYQWYHDDVAIPGANTRTFAVGSAETTDSGNYYVVVNNSVNTLTSTVAQVTVAADTFKPVVKRIAGSANLNEITVEYDERVVLTGELLDGFNYTLIGGVDTSPDTVTVLDPGSLVSGTLVRLTFANPLVENTVYQLKIQNVPDLVTPPNVIDATIAYPFRTWVMTPANGVIFEVFTGIGGTPIANLTNSPNFPNNPTVRTNLSSFSSRGFLLDDTLDNYGGRLRGMFIPQASGNWIFALSSDDASQLFFNPNGPDPAGKVLLTEETACCNGYASHITAAFPLVAGQAYYIEALYKEGGGGDYCHVWAGLQGTTPPTAAAASLTVFDTIPGAMLGYPLAPAGAAGSIGITLQPTNVVTEENQFVTFTVGATNTYGLPMVFQWRRDGVPIPNATASSYTLVTTTADNGAVFTAEAAIIGAKQMSAAATLTVNADNVPPTVVSARADQTFTNISITFSELMHKLNTESAFGYDITGPNAPAVLLGTLQPDGLTVVLTLQTPLDVDTLYTVAITEASDLAGNLANTSTQVQSWKVTTGFVTFQTYNTSPAGVGVDILKSSPDYPNNPRETFYIPSFNTRDAYPDDSHEQFGGRLFGVFIPPTSGNWIFYLRSDDASELYFNPSGPQNSGKTLLLAEPACCGPFSRWTSAPQALVAGQHYYLEALYKEGTGGDYCQVAAKLDTDPTNPDSLSPIPGSMLGTFINPVGISLAITQQPTDQVGVVSTPGKILLAQDFNAGDGGFTVTNSGGVTAPWTYNPASGSWICYHADACASGQNATRLYSPSLTVSEAGHLGIVLKHRYSFEGGDWDGAQLLVSINDGPFTTVPASAFTQGGYETTSFIGNHQLTGQAGWNGDSPGYGAGTYIISQADLGLANAGDTVKVQLIGAWDECTTGQNPNWQIDEIVVLEAVKPLYEEDFTAGDGGFTVANIGTVSGPWVFNAGTGTWSADGGEGIVASLLSSPAITVSKDGFVKLTFNHRYNFEDGSTLWDGGMVQISVNGGTYTQVPAENFSSNGYAPGLFLGNGIIKDKRGFNGQSDGYTNNAFITSIASLGAFRAGDTISVQFAGSWDDGFIMPPTPNWEIDQLSLDDGIAVPVTFSVAATAVVPGATTTPITYQWQRDTGTGFEDILGAASSNLTFFVVQADDGNLYRCVVSVPGASVTSDSALLTIGGGEVRPSLDVVLAGGTATISWSAEAAGYVLDQTSTLAGAPVPWTLVPVETYQTIGNTRYVVVPAGPGSQFFRLRKP